MWEEVLFDFLKINPFLFASFMYIDLFITIFN